MADDMNSTLGLDVWAKAAVYSTGAHDAIDANDWVSILSLLEHWWGIVGGFQLVCLIDKGGRVVGLSDWRLHDPKPHSAFMFDSFLPFDTVNGRFPSLFYRGNFHLSRDVAAQQSDVLPCLESIRIRFPSIFMNVITSWLTARNKRLPSFNKLHIETCFDEGHTLFFLRNLVTGFGDSTNIAEKLTVLSIKKSFPMADKQAAYIMLEILPKFPNLAFLKITHVLISSLKVVIDKLYEPGKSSNFLPPKSLRRLDEFLGFRGYYTIEDDWGRLQSAEFSKYKPTILRFLEIFNTVCFLGFDGFMRGDVFDPDIEYALMQNRAGRSLMRPVINKPCLPLSVWPLVLEKAHSDGELTWQMSAKVTRLYYLLREGPVFFG